MSELAFTVFEVPATVTAWHVRRLKPRGAPRSKEPGQVSAGIVVATSLLNP